jgi:hypothetical protein
VQIAVEELYRLRIRESGMEGRVRPPPTQHCRKHDVSAQANGDRLFSRAFDRQVAVSHVRAAIVKQLTYLGMPNAVRAGQIAPTV